MGNSAPRHRDYRILAAILVTAAGVRFYPIWFGLPHTQARPDESVVNGIALHFLTGDLNPHFYDYPTLFMYVVAVLYLAYYVVGRAAGLFASLPHFLAQWNESWSAFYLIGRGFVALLGTATVLIVYRLAARLFGHRCGLLAALFLAASFLHARDSHFGVTDVPMTFMAWWASLLVIRAHLERAPRQFLYAGFIAGLAASIKYNAILLTVTLLASQAIELLDARREHRSPWSDRRLPLFLAALGAGFLFGTPYAVFDTAGLMEGLRRVSAHLEQGHGIDLGRGWTYHLAVSLRYGVGLPVLAAGLAGLAVIASRNWRIAVLLSAFPIASFAAAGNGRTVFVRYVIVAVPLLCITAAVAVDELARRVAGAMRIPPRLLPAMTALLAALAILPSAVNLIRLDVLLGRRDTRVIAADWIRKTIPAGASVYRSGSIYGRPELEDPPWARHFELWELDSRAAAFVADGQRRDGSPDWIVIQESALEQYSKVPARVRDLLASGDYVLVASFKAADLAEAGRNVYDQQDAFFLPLTGFHGIRRPGPNLAIYRRGPRVSVIGQGLLHAIERCHDRVRLPGIRVDPLHLRSRRTAAVVADLNRRPVDAHRGDATIYFASLYAYGDITRSDWVVRYAPATMTLIAHLSASAAEARAFSLLRPSV